MAALQNIIWKKEFDTGIVLIDKQHRNLVDIINNLNEAHNQKREKEVLRETILKLVEYTKNHFRFEENHMSQLGFPELEEHKVLHSSFIQKMIDILTQLKKENYENLTDDILVFLHKWMIDHIQGDDKEYGNFYKLKNQNS